MIPTTIAAIATPVGCGGIGIIRISGPLSFSIGAQLFVSNQKRPVQDKPSSFPYRSHHIYFGRIQNIQQTSFLDEVLIVFMQGPKTYTREDVVEIHCHSGHQTLQSILLAVFEAGAVPAEPGEFTRRAFLNGRIDLTQAESVIDLINARSEAAREIAFSQISGQLKDKISSFTAVLTEILARIQATVEFPEDVPDDMDLNQLGHDIVSQVLQPIEKLIENHKQSYSLATNFRAVLVGAPNVGKSSLMNLLARKQKSIVTPQPGTTRDLIEEYVQFSGTSIVLADTAGMHPTENMVEKLGIEIAQQQIRLADLILFVIQADKPFSSNERSIFQICNGKPVILIINKIDLHPAGTALENLSNLNFYATIHTSATQNQGIDLLQQAIERFVNSKLSAFFDPVMPNLRQKDLLESTRLSINHFMAGLSNNVPLDLLVIDLQDAIANLEVISGKFIQVDILNTIFDNFCIGK